MEVVEEEQAVEILVGWRQQRENLSKEQLKRGFGPSTPDVKSLEKRVRCYNCREVGRFSKNCRKPRTGKGGRKGKSKGKDNGVGVVFAEGHPEDVEFQCEVCMARDMMEPPVLVGEPWEDTDWPEEEFRWTPTGWTPCRPNSNAAPSGWMAAMARADREHEEEIGRYIDEVTNSFHTTKAVDNKMKSRDTAEEPRKYFRDLTRRGRREREADEAKCERDGDELHVR